MNDQNESIYERSDFMTVQLGDFLQSLIETPTLFIIVILMLGVILVNGWTDAPNAIATMVSTRSMSVKKSILLAAIFNFLGVLIVTSINASVATTVANMVDFDGNPHDSIIALCAALSAIVSWATAAWYFGIPTSESHALIAGISGAAIALQGGVSGINSSEWVKVIYGLFFSTLLGFGLGYLFTNLIQLLFRKVSRQKSEAFFKKGQIIASAGMAFMHGAQDGQKFMGIFMLSIFLGQDKGEITNFVIPIWMMILCSVVMALGTSIGGYKIIKTVGIDMVKLERYQGFSADMAGAFSLLVSSLFGLPVSTTHTKTTAIMGVGAANRLSSINWLTVKEMVLAWILTFPGCGLVGYLMALLFIKIF